MKNNTKIRFFAGALFNFIVSSETVAMEVLSEHEMGAVTGQDGVTISLQADTVISADQIRWNIDGGSSAPSYENTLIIGAAGELENSFRVFSVSDTGAASSDLLDISVAIDAYTNSQDRAGIGIDSSWSRMRVQADSLTVNDVTRSFGTVALDSAGRFAVFGDGGLFNATGDSARVILNVGNVQTTGATPTQWQINDPGILFYRAGAPDTTEIQLANFGLLFDMHQGSLGIDDSGLFLSSTAGSRTDLNLTFDIYANEMNGPDDAFTFDPVSSDGGITGSIPMLYFGWRGGLENVDLRARPLGAWDSLGSHTQGLTASLGFDLASDFQFVIGEAKPEVVRDRGKSYLEFTDPVSLPSTLRPDRKDVEFGYITLDAVSANQGVGGICYGGLNSFGNGPSACSSASGGILPVQLVDVPPSESGLALIAREWGLHAYSSNVSYRDGAGAAAGLDVENEGWALIYTLGDVSSNIYLYPKAGNGTGTPGSASFQPALTMDIVTAIQTIGEADDNGKPDLSRWENGTHLMIGDTGYNDPTDPDVEGLAIGLVGSDLLFAAEEMAMGLSLGDGLNFSSDEARLQIRGMFAGGDIPHMKSPVYGAYIDMNFEMDKFIFKLLPALTGDYINFGGYLSFTNLTGGFSNGTNGAHSDDDGSYISIAEPNFDKLSVDFRLADIQGDIEIPGDVVGGGGKIDLLSATAESDDRPKLRIETNMKVGATATKPGGAAAGPGDPLSIGRVEFGGKNLGSIVMPTGQIYTSLTLKQQ